MKATFTWESSRIRCKTFLATSYLSKIHFSLGLNIVKKFFFSLAGLINAISGTLTFILIGRAIGVELYGSLVTVVAVITIFYSTGSMGIPLYLIHKRNIKDKNFYVAIYCYIAFCIISSLIIAGLVIDSKNIEIELWKIYLLSLIVFQVLYDLTMSFLQVKNDFIGMSKLTLSLNLVRLIFVLIIYAFNVNEILYYVEALIISNIFLLFQSYKILKEKIIDPGEVSGLIIYKNITQIIKDSLPYAGEAFLYIGYFQITTIILSYNCNSICVAQYSVAYTLTSATYLFAIIYFQKIAQIKIIDSMKNSKEKLKKSIINNALIATIAGTFISIIIYYIGEKLIDYLYGNDFIPISYLITIIAFTIPIRYMISALAAHMMTPYQTKLKMYIIGTVLLISVATSSLLTTWYGGLGAAISILVSEISWLFIMASIFYFFIYRKYHKDEI